jgi:hypothetical protein
MKRILLGALVAAIIAFVFQAIAWMGEFYPNFTNLTKNQDSILQNLSTNLDEDGLYSLPTPPENSTNEEKEQYMQNQVGKPWAMVFYHPKMEDDMAASMSLGIVHNFITAFLMALIIYYGSFSSFWKRFFVSFAIILVVIQIGVMDEYLWWSFPMQFILPQIIDLIVGWGLASLWMAYFVKKTVS